MFSWISFALALLKLVNGIMTWAHERELISEGTDAEIAKTSAAIMRKTSAGKAIMEKVDAMSDAEVDDGLRNLEPGVSKNVR